MKPTTIALCVGVLAVALPAVAAPRALRLVGRTELPGYTGDFDHFAYDRSGNRLWLAAEDHGTLDLFDLKTGKLRKSFKGIVDTPHSILYLEQKARLIITDSGGPGLTKLVDAKTHQLKGTLKLAAPTADAMGYDPSTKRLYIVNGGRDAKLQETYLSAVNPVTLERFGDLKFETDKVEAMAIEEKGNR